MPLNHKYLMNVEYFFDDEMVKPVLAFLSYLVNEAVLHSVII